MILLAAAVAAFQPVKTISEVTTSKGKHYRLETCFRDPKNLTTRFIYPEHIQTFAIRDGQATTSEDGGSAGPASDADKRIALGHNFHAIYLNLPRLSAPDGSLVYGGSLTPSPTPGRWVDGYRFNSPDTTPIEVRFSEWQQGKWLPNRVTLTHAGVTYDYRFTKIELRC